MAECGITFSATALHPFNTDVNPWGWGRYIPPHFGPGDVHSIIPQNLSCGKNNNNIANNSCKKRGNLVCLSI